MTETYVSFGDQNLIQLIFNENKWKSFQKLNKYILENSIQW